MEFKQFLENCNTSLKIHSDKLTTMSLHGRNLYSNDWPHKIYKQNNWPTVIPKVKCQKCPTEINNSEQKHVFQSHEVQTLSVDEHIIHASLKYCVYYKANGSLIASGFGHKTGVLVRTQSFLQSCRWPRQTCPCGSYCRFYPLEPPCSYTWTRAEIIKYALQN